MSILIKGMEMPNVEQGVRTINIYADGVVTNYAEETIGNAVPVPPHGRLIDADTFEEHIIKDWEEYDHWFAVEIENRPTIIEAEGSNL